MSGRARAEPRARKRFEPGRRRDTTALDVHSPLFGREVERAAALDALANPSLRLLTVTGRGGVGKTRLMADVVAALREQGRVAVVVALAGVVAAEFVADEIAATLDIAAERPSDVTELLVRHLGRQSLILVLENFEHVLPAAPVISTLLDRCPEVTMLVTSRTPLRLRCERVLALRPLAVPEVGVDDPSVLAGQPAVATYCVRAAAVDVAFALSGDNAPMIADLCRRLDGLPLAIELAAARAATLPAAEICRGLDRAGLDVLRRARGDVDARHQDLRASIDWSYRLLGHDEQRLLNRLSLISGSFDVDAVEGVAPETDVGRLLDQLAALVDFHLVDPLPGVEPARFELASSIRVFARERLERDGDEDRARRMHGASRAAYARAAAAGVESDDEGAWFARLRADHADLLGALDTALDAGWAVEALDLVRGLAPLWEVQGYHEPQHARVEAALAVGATHHGDEVEYASVLSWSALLGARHGLIADVTVVADRLRRAERIARLHRDSGALVRALAFSVRVMPYTGDIDRARTASQEALELAASVGDDYWCSAIEAWSGMLAQLLGDETRAVELGLCAIRRTRGHGAVRPLVLAMMLLLSLRTHREVAEDLPAGEEVLRRIRTTGLTLYETLLLPMLVGTAILDRDRAAALRWAAEALECARAAPASPAVGYCIMTTANVAAMGSDFEIAALLHGAVRADLPELERVMSPPQIATYDHFVECARSALGAERFEARAREGAALTWTSATEAGSTYVHAALLRDEIVNTVPVSPARFDTPRPGDGARLTRRQYDVLRLLVAGLGNKEIATDLGLSAKTVMHHTTAIYRALGVRGRAEAAAVAVRDQLV